MADERSHPDDADAGGITPAPSPLGFGSDPEPSVPVNDESDERPVSSADYPSPEMAGLTPDGLASTNVSPADDGPDDDGPDDDGPDDDGPDDDGPDDDGPDDDEEEPAIPARVGPIEEVSAEDEGEMDWYILKVASNRENTICDALRRRVKLADLESSFGEIIVPTEDVAEFKNGKRRVVKRKLYPGYIVVNMLLNDDTWFLVRETPGIGDFTGSAGRPSPMLAHEVDRIVRAAHPDEGDGEPIKTAIPYKMGDRVRIKEGTFENFEGDVEGVDEANGRVTVMINIFGRSTPVELEHWQVESV